jgi:hypothetical protein
MRTLVVTAMYDVYQGTLSSLSIDARMKHLDTLLGCDVDIVLFIQPELQSSVKSTNPRLSVVPLPLSAAPTYSLIMSKADLSLPSSRNEEKDKLFYLALINSKIDFMAMAKRILPHFSHYVWIDGSIFKVFKDTETAKKRISSLSSAVLPPNIMFACGLYPPLSKGEDIWVDRVQWRFLGGVLSLPSDMLWEFVDKCRAVVADLIREKRMTWEVNVWAKVESLFDRKLEAYQADHDDSILAFSTVGAP